MTSHVMIISSPDVSRAAMDAYLPSLVSSLIVVGAERALSRPPHIGFPMHGCSSPHRGSVVSLLGIRVFYASTSIPSSCYTKVYGMYDIDCPNSNITIFPTSFSGFKRLGNKVHLQLNRIQTVPGFSDAFRFVRELDLSGNIITTFNWESLKHLKKLKRIDLSFNHLSTVRLNLATEKGLENVQVVVLARNKLAVFSAADLGLTPPGPPWWVQEMYIEDNPIQCDCNMVWLAKLELKIFKRNGKFSHPFSKPFTDFEVPRCASPKRLENFAVGKKAVLESINNQTCGTPEPQAEDKADNFKPRPKQPKFAFRFISEHVILKK
ncbi:hypothetical protein Bbelb_310950 [Branchiostoma belcheri]|nr:hypothetical protein Bbelb_310950 [Branchiostoma belcheri]